MTLTDLEYAWMADDPAIAARLQQRRIGFEPKSSLRPDRRHAFRQVTCPLYDSTRGCTAYARRPLACRVFGPMSNHAIEWDFCSYQATTQHYHDPQAIPHFAEYAQLVGQAGAVRGYLYAEQTRYQRPIFELLTPSAPPLGDAWEQRIRVRLPGLESPCYLPSAESTVPSTAPSTTPPA
jgi:Fe-S-cluster containining protein